MRAGVIFTSGEQDFFAQKGFTNAPSRCPACRVLRRSERGGSTGGSSGSYGGGGYNADPYRSEGYGPGGGFGGGSGRQERQLYSAICSSCGNEARVPFQPRGDRPVYCSDCFTPTRGSGGSGPVATVAAVANRLGMDGWELVQVVNQAHSVYRLSFELAYVMEDDDDQQPPRAREVAAHSG